MHVLHADAHALTAVSASKCSDCTKVTRVIVFLFCDIYISSHTLLCVSFVLFALSVRGQYQSIQETLGVSSPFCRFGLARKNY